MTEKRKYFEPGKRLRESRHAANLSQGKLAKKLGCHPQFVSNIERGLCLPPRHLLREWLSAVALPKAEWIEIELKVRRLELEALLSNKKARR